MGDDFDSSAKLRLCFRIARNNLYAVKSALGQIESDRPYIVFKTAFFPVEYDKIVIFPAYHAKNALAIRYIVRYLSFKLNVGIPVCISLKNPVIA